ncbi:MAG: hypothetical protein QXI84_08065, partial [Thermofilaceae archaeon]
MLTGVINKTPGARKLSFFLRFSFFFFFSARDFAFVKKRKYGSCSLRKALVFFLALVLSRQNKLEIG